MFKKKQGDFFLIMMYGWSLYITLAILGFKLKEKSTLNPQEEEQSKERVESDNRLIFGSSELIDIAKNEGSLDELEKVNSNIQVLVNFGFSKEDILRIVYQRQKGELEATALCVRLVECGEYKTNLAKTEIMALLFQRRVGRTRLINIIYQNYVTEDAVLTTPNLATPSSSRKRSYHEMANSSNQPSYLTEELYCVLSAALPISKIPKQNNPTINISEKLAALLTKLPLELKEEMGIKRIQRGLLNMHYNLIMHLPTYEKWLKEKKPQAAYVLEQQDSTYASITPQEYADLADLYEEQNGGATLEQHVSEAPSTSPYNQVSGEVNPIGLTYYQPWMLFSPAHPLTDLWNQTAALNYVCAQAQANQIVNQDLNTDPRPNSSAPHAFFPPQEVPNIKFRKIAPYPPSQGLSAGNRNILPALDLADKSQDVRIVNRGI